MSLNKTDVFTRLASEGCLFLMEALRSWAYKVTDVKLDWHQELEPEAHMFEKSI